MVDKYEQHLAVCQADISLAKSILSSWAQIRGCMRARAASMGWNASKLTKLKADNGAAWTLTNAVAIIREDEKFRKGKKKFRKGKKTAPGT